MLTPTLITDLTRCAADATAVRDRSAAVRLLATELAADLRANSRNFRANHIAFALENDEAPSPDLGRIVTLSRAWGGYHASSYAGIEVGAEPAGAPPTGTVPAAATSLVAGVRASLGTATFEAHRMVVARSSCAEPGQAFPLTGLLEVALPVALSTGTYRIELRDVRLQMPHSNAVGASIGVSLRVGGSIVATHSLTRTATGDQEPREALVAFTTTDDVAMTAGDGVELVAAGLNAAMLLAHGGIVRFWRIS